MTPTVLFLFLAAASLIVAIMKREEKLVWIPSIFIIILSLGGYSWQAHREKQAEIKQVADSTTVEQRRRDDSLAGALRNEEICIDFLCAQRELLGLPIDEIIERSSRYKNELNKILPKQKTKLDSAVFYVLGNEPTSALQLLSHVETCVLPDTLAFMTWYIRGLASSLQTNYVEAIAFYDSALLISPGQLEAINNRGVCQIALKKYSEAIADFNLVIDIDPKSFKALNNKGSCLSDLGRHSEAMLFFDEALEIKSNYAGAYYNKGNSLAALKLHKEAIAQFDSALMFRANYYEAANNKGNSLAALGLHENAITEYKAALNTNPNAHDAYYDMGNSYLALGHYLDANAAFDSALKYGPNDTDVLINKGYCLSLMDSCSSAILIYDRAIKMDPRLVGAYLNKGACLAALNRHKEAVAVYNTALTLKAHNPYIKYNIASSFSRLKQQADMIRMLKEATAAKKELKQTAQTDPNFDFYRDDPDFRKLVGLE